MPPASATDSHPAAQRGAQVPTTSQAEGADYNAGVVSHEPAAAAPSDPLPIDTDLTLPPTKRTKAPRPEQLDAEEYFQADTAHGLQVVGGLKGWFTKNEDHWGPSKNFTGFASEARLTHPAQLELCARRAVLEALAVQAVGARPLLVDGWRAEGGWERVLGLRVSVDGEGKAVVEGDVKGVVQGLVADVNVRDTIISVDQARELVKVTNTEWKSVSLKDALLKFAVCRFLSPLGGFPPAPIQSSVTVRLTLWLSFQVAKRIFQLTGHAIPDAKLLHVDTMGELLATLVKPPPARRVYEAVQRRGELAKLPNVSVYQSRRTPVDAAKDLGRWKIVERELNKRGLPVLGQENIDRFREREWFHGPQPEKSKKRSRRNH